MPTVLDPLTHSRLCASHSHHSLWLQAWAASLADPNGGSVTGMPAAITSRQALSDVLTAIIFTCGPQHSAINYTQFDYGGYALNMPLCARKKYHELVDRPASEEISEKELLAFLPNLDMTRCVSFDVFSLSHGLVWCFGGDHLWPAAQS